MLSATVPLTLLLSLAPSAFSSPLAARQTTPAHCAPQPFQINGFQTFTPAAGTSGLSSSISFQLVNPNAGGDSPVTCTQSFADGKDPARDQFFQCRAGTEFRYYPDGVLTAWQSMVCGGSSTGETVIAFANGSIPLMCYDQTYPADQNGRHCETPTASANIPVTSVQ